jgi:hypothetical protein
VFEINEYLYVVELKKSSGDCSLYRKVLPIPLIILYLNGLNKKKRTYSVLGLPHEWGLEKNNRGKPYPCIFAERLHRTQNLWLSGKASYHYAKPVLHLNGLNVPDNFTLAGI